MAMYTGDQVEQLRSWLILHGANTDEVTLDGDMTITTDENGERWLNWVEYATTLDGSRYFNAFGTAAAVDKHKTRLLAEPPDWWEPQIQPTRERLRSQLNAVYRERAHLVAHLAAILPAVMADDPSDPDWRIVYLDTPSGQWSWHINRDDLDLFAHVPDGDAEWDSHTTEQKYQRMRELTAVIAEQRATL